MYSGITAMSASTAIAKDADTSNCATSAAHDSRNAAPMIPTPNMSDSSAGSRCMPPNRIITPGIPTPASNIIETQSLPLDALVVKECYSNSIVAERKDILCSGLLVQAWRCGGNKLILAGCMRIRARCTKSLTVKYAHSQCRKSPENNLGDADDFVIQLAAWCNDRHLLTDPLPQ